MVLASIITFNPDRELLMKNIAAILPQVDKVLIIENNSTDKYFLINIINHYPDVVILSNVENFGIAKALNQSLAYAHENNYDWLLTLDQDSVCENNMISKYFDFLSTNKNFDLKNLLLLCPRTEDVNRLSKEIIINEVEEVDTAITSGSFMNVDKSLIVGGFLEELFIDYVDFEFCLRARILTFKILKLNNIILHHRLGEIKEKRFLGRTIVITNHKPVRRYYLFRSKVFIYKQYFLRKKKWVLRNFISSIKVFFIILFFEKSKRDNFYNICKGIKAGLKMKR